MTRERERYSRASIVERIRGAWAWFVGNRRAQVIAVILLGMLLAMRALTPETVSFEGLRTDDCIFVRTPSSDDIVSENPVGSPKEVADTLRSQGAERAACGLSHSHEVAAVGDLTDPPGTPYPGEAVLVEREMAACEAAVGEYVGRPVGESRYGAVVVVPDIAGWEAGARDIACLVQRDDGRFMDRQAKGSGE